MAKKPIPTPAELRQLLRYEPETGKLFWRERSANFFKSATRSLDGVAAHWNRRWAGREALTSADETGHLSGRVLGKGCYAHRVAWAIYYGEWPTDDIDHINQDPADNRIANLRDVARGDNQRNQRLRKTNKFGAHSVEQVGPSKWRARIKVGEKTICLGRFDRLEDAVSARKAAEAEYGYHPNHGT